MMRIREMGVLGVVATIGLVGCDDPASPEVCANDVGTPLAGESCLVWEAGPELDARRAQIEGLIEDAVSRVQAVMPVPGVAIYVREQSAGSIPELGFGGFNPSASEVRLTFDAGSPQLDSHLPTDLGPMVAHEMHHPRRRRAVGYGSQLGQAVISEGLADHFALELFGGDPPPWSTALSEEQLAEFRSRLGADFTRQPYSHDDWFFGTDPSIPRWTGYSVGFDLVQSYLESSPGSAPSGLFGEPASSFRP